MVGHGRPAVKSKSIRRSYDGSANASSGGRNTHRSGNKPVDVSDVEDLTVHASNQWVASLELDGDWSVSKVGCHGEVGNRGNKGDTGGDVVEDTSVARNSEAQTHEGEGRDSHDSGDSPVPVRSMSGDVDVGHSSVKACVGVGIQGIVCSLLESHLG